MMTTRARLGRSRVSVIALDLLEQAREITGREAGRGAVEPLHRPRPEVELDRAHGVLDRAPQGPPVHADQAAEQPGAGDLAPPGLAVGGRRRGAGGSGREMSPGRDVAELEARVVVARPLVVDQPDPVPAVDEVGG